MSRWVQKVIQLEHRPRGFHLVTTEIENHLPELKDFHIGVAHVFIVHTSAGLTINENADPTVRADFERHFRHAIPDGAPYFAHTCEGPDDMSGHLKSSVLGCSVSIPIRNGSFHMGTWQGIYLCEARDHSGTGRNITVTLCGE